MLKIIIIYTALLATIPARAEEQEESSRPSYCPEPVFSIRNDRMPASEALNLPLVSEQEAADPEIGRKLATTPGPYGHSELGFRYLARLFGYKGKFGGKDEVEGWLAEQERSDYRAKRGLHQAWEQWVVSPAKRLSVPAGPVSSIPARAGPEIFFRDGADQGSFDYCIAVRLKTMACENYLGDRPPESGDRVKFAMNDAGIVPCRIVRNPYGYETRRLEIYNEKHGGQNNASGISRSAR